MQYVSSQHASASTCLLQRIPLLLALSNPALNAPFYLPAYLVLTVCNHLYWRGAFSPGPCAQHNMGFCLLKGSTGRRGKQNTTENGPEKAQNSSKKKDRKCRRPSVKCRLKNSLISVGSYIFFVSWNLSVLCLPQRNLSAQSWSIFWGSWNSFLPPSPFASPCPDSDATSPEFSSGFAKRWPGKKPHLLVRCGCFPQILVGNAFSFVFCVQSGFETRVEDRSDTIWFQHMESRPWPFLFSPCDIKGAIC